MRKKIIIFLLVALVVILAASVFFRGGSNNDVRDATRTAADTFMERLVDSNVIDSYGQLTDSLKEDTSQEEWRDQLEIYKNYETTVQLKSRSDAKGDYPEGSQELIYTLDFGTGKAETSVIMVSEGTAWKVAKVEDK